MSNKLKNKEPEAQRPEQPTPTQQLKSDWKVLIDKLSYRAIVSNTPFLIFIALLCILYITNSQRAVDLQKQISAANDTLKELRWKNMDVNSQLIRAKEEMEITEKAKGMGLNALKYPAYEIQKDTNTNNKER